MAITAFGFPGSVQEVEFSKMMSAVAGHGLIGTYNGTEFSAARVPGARSMSILAGACWAPGIYVEMDATTTSPAAAANISGLPRIDLVVMRVNWSTHTATLVNIPGTPNANPQPPTFNKQPGVIFDIPLRQAVLPSGDADYTATAISQGDRRVWLVDGVRTAASSTILTAEPTGAVLAQPDVKRLLVRNGTAWDTYKAESDSGISAIVGPYPGFTGSTWGQIKNGVAFITFPWTKGSTAMTNQDISITLPASFTPAFDWTFVLFAGSPKAPILLTMHSGSRVISMDSVTLNAGGAIRGSIQYPVV